MKWQIISLISVVSILFLFLSIPLGQMDGVVSYTSILNKGGDNYTSDGVYTGLKWECVEFVRRYYVQIFGVTFPSIADASELTSLPYFVDLSTQKRIPVQTIAVHEIQRGDIVVFSEGHCALVATDKDGQQTFRIAEQNKGWQMYRTCKKNDPTIVSIIRPKYHTP